MYRTKHAYVIANTAIVLSILLLGLYGCDDEIGDLSVSLDGVIMDGEVPVKEFELGVKDGIPESGYGWDTHDRPKADYASTYVGIPDFKKFSSADGTFHLTEVMDGDATLFVRVNGLLVGKKVLLDLKKQENRKGIRVQLKK